jgi:hypothetical protein
MFPVNSNIIVQNIQLLGVNGNVQNSVVFMAALYKIKYCVHLNQARML